MKIPQIRPFHKKSPQIELPDDEKKDAAERILALLKRRDGWLSSGEIDRLAEINRPTYTSRILTNLTEEKKLLRKKDGRNVLYRQNLEHIFYEGNLELPTIDENAVFAMARASEEYKSLVSERVDTIFTFAFTEMLNNAKDHSHSGFGYVKVWEERGTLKFIVKDAGIGVFRSIMTARQLKNETEAIQDLVKGKVTTRPESHSGEGIFWTSRMSDRFVLSSYDYALLIDNLADDYTIARPGVDRFVGSGAGASEGGGVELNAETGDVRANAGGERGFPYVRGTEVQFEISASSGKSAAEIFSKFALDKSTFSFDATEIPLKLYGDGGFWVSRSQAKRVLSGLEKYKKITIDFKGIDLVGQGFADEIFRVFNIAHPEIIIEPINMSESVRLLVEWARRDPTGRA